MLRHLKLKIKFRIDNEKLLENYKAILTKIEDLKKNILKALPVYYERYIKNKTRTKSLY